jgi:hypothetical protein
MKRLRNARHAFEAHHLCNVLAAAGIAASVRNEFVGGALGELPVDACGAEVWIDDVRQEAMALALLREASLPSNTDSWYCLCGEWIEGQFFACWNCAASRQT